MIASNGLGVRVGVPEDVNDLAHRAGIELRAQERCAYNDTHYMDCTAVQWNRVIGIQRVKVVVARPAHYVPGGR